MDFLDVGLMSLVYYTPVIGGVGCDIVMLLKLVSLQWWRLSGGGCGVVVVVTPAVTLAIPILVGWLYVNVFMVRLLLVMVGGGGLVVVVVAVVLKGY